MRKTIYIDGRQYRHDSEVPKSHVIIGQRDEAREHPRFIKTKVVDGKEVEFEATKVEDLTDDEWQTIHDFTIALTSGRFRLKPLDWAGSSEEAVEKSKQFPTPEWINVKIYSITDLGGSVQEHA